MVRDGYLQLAKEEPGRIRVVNAAQTPEEVQEDIRKIVDEVLTKIM
jgi:thymidylate kinase